MASDRFNNHADSLLAPARDCFAIVPHDTQSLVTTPKAIYIGTGGDLVLRALNSEIDVTFRNLADGSILDVRAAYVRAAGTTAADLVGLA